MRSTIVISLIALLAFACGANDDRKPAAGKAESAQSESTQAATSISPEELGELGARIRKTPDRANELLRERGLTEQTFETEIRKVTENPDASKRYAAAYKKASA